MLPFIFLPSLLSVPLHTLYEQHNPGRTMEQKITTIAVIGTPSKAVTPILRHFCRCHCFFSCPERECYSYMEQDYQLIRMSQPCLPSLLPDILLLICSLSPSCPALSLEQGLELLAQLIRLPLVKESGLPIVLCITSPKSSLLSSRIDFDLLEDVLQIPVVPCPHNLSGPDDAKAAIAYAKSLHFSYDCLDFSPGKLASEILAPAMEQNIPSEQQNSRIFLSPAGGILFLFLLLFFLLWLAFTGALSLSGLLTDALPWQKIGATPSTMILSAFSWMVPVLLPPLLFFFPLFFLLDASGIFPRAAFYGDRVLAPWGGCGSQCITMTLGLGCHAAGILGCRRIPCPRERLTAILTTPLLPCWGRFPVFIALTPLFFAAASTSTCNGALQCTGPFLAALCLSAVILIGSAASLCLSCFLSHTLLSNLPSGFYLELPRIGLPQNTRAILKEAWSRTCLILGKITIWTAFLSFAIWLLASFPSGGFSLLNGLVQFLKPLGHILGLDGVILAAFLLATPANELLLPTIVLIYLYQSGLPPISSPGDLSFLLQSQGWTWQTVLSVTVFALFHWPCLTTLQAVYQETRSLPWTITAFLIPTLPGIGICTILHWLQLPLSFL